MINDRDDWLSPAAFVAGVDFEAKPPITEGVVEYHSAVGWNPRPEWMVIEAQSPANPAPVLVYDPSIDERVPVTQEWVDLAVNRMAKQHREIQHYSRELTRACQGGFVCSLPLGPELSHAEQPARRHLSALEIIRASLGQNQLMAQSQWLECGDGPKVGSQFRIRIPSAYTVYDCPAPKMENLK
jgi:hypothetical protein